MRGKKDRRTKDRREGGRKEGRKEGKKEGRKEEKLLLKLSTQRQEGIPEMGMMWKWE